MSKHIPKSKCVELGTNRFESVRDPQYHPLPNYQSYSKSVLYCARWQTRHHSINLSTMQTDVQRAMKDSNSTNIVLAMTDRHIQISREQGSGKAEMFYRR
jgi:hypothetical protein